MYDSRLLKRLIALALDEDLGFGDPTSTALPRATCIQKATILAREELVVCGAGIAELVFHELGVNAVTSILEKDGTVVEEGEAILVIEAQNRFLLSAERTILNFMQRLSGIATHVRRVVDAGPEIELLDTRKTTPGWRVLEKYAVRVGGAKNHRMSLADMILVKNNHLDVSDSDLVEYFAALKVAKAYYVPIQVEIRDLAELERITPFAPESLLLDNMSVNAVKACMEFILHQEKWHPTVEISGRVTPDDCIGMKELGVSAASTSFLMHGARPVDISLRM
jgi:nicotinate-nucleotide pyrophosphorylase (carboxylating)